VPGSSGQNTSRLYNDTGPGDAVVIPKWLWATFRFALIVFGLVQGPRLATELSAPSTRVPSWGFAIEMIAIVAVGVVFVVGLQAGRRSSTQPWIRPSWFENPFGPGRWVCLFDFASYYMVAAGIGGAVFELRAIPKTWAWEIPFAIGIGLWLGARICLLAFRPQFCRTTHS
jgi:hypothetical protein